MSRLTDISRKIEQVAKKHPDLVTVSSFSVPYNIFDSQHMEMDSITVRVGNGDRKFINTYGTHGDEIPALMSLPQTIEEAVKYERALSKVSWYGIITNPRAVVDVTRRAQLTEEDSIEVNRNWYHQPLSLTRKSIANQIHLALKEFRGAFFLDHHSDNRLRSLFRKKEGYFITAGPKNLRPPILNYERLIKESMQKVGDLPVEEDGVQGTLLEYVTDRLRIPGLAFEDCRRLKKGIEERTQLHTNVSIALLNYFAKR